ncbi:MAG: hypothetical protein J6P69_08955 [Bacteroidales bacterium]|nr:hypothetical protein [Bacteroidales bacterium]
MKRIAFKSVMILAMVFSLVSGCQCSRIDIDKTGYEQVLILYSGGYNSLRDYLYEDIQDLKKGYAPTLKSDKAFLVVSHLAVKRGDYRTETSPQLIRVFSDKKNGVVLDTLKSYNGTLSEKSTMNSILSDIKRQFPSKHYGMVFSSHASGWLPVGYYNNPDYYEPSHSAGRKGSAAPVFPKGTYPFIEPELQPGEPLTKSLTMTNGTTLATEMEIAEFKDAIPMHLDYFLLDACLSGGIEVAYEFKDVCDQIGFSQDDILADGFDYKNLAGHLLESSGQDTRAVLDDYYQQYAAKTDRNDRSATISLVDCTKLDAVASLCATLFSKYSTAIAGLDPSTVQRYYRYDKHWFYDMEDILVKAGISESEHKSLTSALNDCILYKAATESFLPGYGGFKIDTFSGLSMYLPCNGSTYLDSFYKDLAWNKATLLVD